jgi:hypothetical protein
MKLKVPMEIRSEKSKQRAVWCNKVDKAMQATDLHKYYKESGAEFKMTFSNFKKLVHKGKIKKH